MAFKLNEYNGLDRKNYGVRVARPGYDAANCADNALLFNSGWPILQIVEAFNILDDLEQLAVVYVDADGNIISGIPSGYEYNYSETYEYPNRTGAYEIGELPLVNTNYVVSKVVQDIYTNYTTHTWVYKYVLYGKRHALGYAPFFFEGRKVAGDAYTKYLLLFNIDIATDVDYPYSDEPLEMYTDAVDYGLKSKSKYALEVPKTGESSGLGLATNMFSKMVQAVKTEQTGEYESEGWYSGYTCAWSPDNVRLNEGATSSQYGELNNFEAFGFTSVFDDLDGFGGLYGYAPPIAFNNNQESGASFRDSNLYAVGLKVGTAYSSNKKCSLVILRSPMVAPEVSEVVYG